MIEDIKKSGVLLKDTDRVVFSKQDDHLNESISDSGAAPSVSRTLAYVPRAWTESHSVPSTVAITVKYARLIGSVARFFQHQRNLPSGVSDRDLAHYDVLIFPKNGNFYVALVHHRSGLVTSAGCFDKSGYGAPAALLNIRKQ